MCHRHVVTRPMKQGRNTTEKKKRDIEHAGRQSSVMIDGQQCELPCFIVSFLRVYLLAASRVFGLFASSLLLLLQRQRQHRRRMTAQDISRTRIRIRIRV